MTARLIRPERAPLTRRRDLPSAVETFHPRMALSRYRCALSSLADSRRQSCLRIARFNQLLPDKWTRGLRLAKRTDYVRPTPHHHRAGSPLRLGRRARRWIWRQPDPSPPRHPGHRCRSTTRPGTTSSVDAHCMSRSVTPEASCLRVIDVLVCRVARLHAVRASVAYS